MQLAMLVTACLVLGQPPGTASPLPRHRSSPPEMVAEALTLRPDSRLLGRPTALLAALSSTADAGRQLDVTHAYWQLAEVVGVYQIRLEQDRQLQALEATGEQAAAVRAARAASTAAVQEAEVAAVAAQHDLAALLLLPPSAPLPLPADRPHVGPYRTYFSELMAGRTPPGKTRLIDRTLPIRYEAIDGRAAALQAAEDARIAAVDELQSGQGDLAAVLACIDESTRQRQALIRSVCRYNHDIADYALAVAAAGSSPQALVAMLINPRAEPPRQGQTVPRLAERPGRRVPTPASPDTRPPSSDPRVPAPATQWAPSPPEGAVEPAAGPQGEGAGLPGAVPPDQIPTPVEPEPSPTAPAPPSELPGGHAADLTPAVLYPGLAGASPENLAGELALALNCDCHLPKPVGAPIGLEDCLRGRPAVGHGEMIAAYWIARQRAGEYEVLARQYQLLDDLLTPPRADRRPLRLRLLAARASTDAALIEGLTALIEAQYELASRLGRESEALWPMPDAVPLAGGFSLALDAQPARLIQAWPVRRLAVMIPGLEEAIRRRAVAVIEADAARAAVGGQAGEASIESLLAPIARQTEQSLAFLVTLTDYNRAIAEYALMVLPAETPGEKLAAVLTSGQVQSDN